MAEHEHGTMNIDAQQKTFDGFIKFVQRAVIAIFVFLIFLAMING